MDTCIQIYVYRYMYTDTFDQSALQQESLGLPIIGFLIANIILGKSWYRGSQPLEDIWQVHIFERLKVFTL